MTYLRTHGATSSASPAPTVVGVPMHPQIRQVGPGNCPICGMTLEPVKATAEVGENHGLTDMTRRFWVGSVLTVPVFVLEMGGHIPALGMHELVSPQVSTWIQFALSTPVVLWAGWPFFQRAWASIVHGSLNMFSLIALGTGSAYLYTSLPPSRLICSQPVFTAWAVRSRLFRSRGGDHRSRVAGPGAGIACPRADRRCDPRVAETGSQNGAPLESRWPGRGSGA